MGVVTNGASACKRDGSRFGSHTGELNISFLFIIYLYEVS